MQHILYMMEQVTHVSPSKPLNSWQLIHLPVICDISNMTSCISSRQLSYIKSPVVNCNAIDSIMRYQQHITWAMCTVLFCYVLLPEASFGLRVLSLPACVCVCVRVSVRQSSACPCNNSSTVQARITKFGPEMEKTLVKIPIILWDDWPWTSRSNRT